MSDPAGKPLSLAFTVHGEGITSADGEPGYGSLALQTDAEGKVEFEARLGSDVFVRCDDPKWVLSIDGDRFKPRQKELRAVAWPAGVLRLRIQYDTGEPFVGIAFLTTTWGGKIIGLCSAQFADKPLPKAENIDPKAALGRDAWYEVAEIKGLAVGAEIVVSVTSDKPGYTETKRAILPSELNQPGEVVMTLKPGVSRNAVSSIQLVWPEDQAIKGFVQFYQINAQGESYLELQAAQAMTQTRKVYPGKYRMRLVGEYAWDSGEIDLPPGTVLKVHPVLAPSAKVRATVLDDKGAPIPGAVLEFAHLGDGSGRPRNWSSRDRVDSHAAGVAGADGKAVLPGQPVGTTTFKVEAPGFEPVTRVVTLASGEDVDFGEVRLERAAGKLVINLPAWDYAAREIRICILTPYGGNLTPVGKEPVATSSRFEFSGLVRGRTYAVAVMGRGGSIKVFNGVVATAAEPVVTLDATDAEDPEE